MKRSELYNETGERRCPSCEKFKPLDQYRLILGHDKSHRVPNSSCKACEALYKKNARKTNPEKAHAYDRIRRERDKERGIKRVYPRDPIKRKAERKDPPILPIMLAKQNSACAICGTPMTTEVYIWGENSFQRRNLSIDHDHKTGKLRGLLCSLCNTGLGSFRDNPELLTKAIKYLERHKEIEPYQNTG